MAASGFPGPGNITQFLKGVTKRRLEELDIDPAMWVDKNFSDKTRKNRQRRRGKAIEPEVDEVGAETSDAETEEDEVLTPPEPEATNENLNGTGVTVGNVSNISEILASNNIDINVNSSAMLDHNFLPNISTISGDVPPEASSTLDRDDNFPSSGSNQNIVTSILTELPPTFQPRRKRPSELNCALAAPPTTRPRRTPLTRSRSNPVNFNIPNPLNVEVGQARNADTDMHIARDILDLFTTSAENNTNQGLETGGILAGHFLEDEARYEVTHLVIPIQTGMPDSWTVSDERQITNFFITHPDLILLGLIHTHPNTSSSLTSMDLHSLWSYAKMNPAIVSLVVTPDDNLINSFSMTPLGLSEIRSCRQTGFHQHSYEDTRLFMESPHVIYDETMSTILVDHRLPE